MTSSQSYLTALPATASFTTLTIGVMALATQSYMDMALGNYITTAAQFQLAEGELCCCVDSSSYQPQLVLQP